MFIFIRCCHILINFCCFIMLQNAYYLQYSYIKLTYFVKLCKTIQRWFFHCISKSMSCGLQVCFKHINPFMPTIPTFAVRETLVSRTANVGKMGMNGLIYLIVMSCQYFNIYTSSWFM